MGKKLRYLGVFLLGDFILGTFIESALYSDVGVSLISTVIGFLTVTVYYAATNIDRLMEKDLRAWGWTGAGIFMILMSFVTAGAIYTTMDDIQTEQSFSPAQPVVYQDFSYIPPQDWKQYTYSGNNSITRLADYHRLYTPEPESETAVLFMTYRTRQNYSTFTTNESIDAFFNRIQRTNRGKDFNLLDQEVQEINGTKWLTYNYSMQRDGEQYKMHYQVSVSKGRYYALGYFAPGDTFSEHYEKADSTMRDAVLITPLPEIPEVEPVEPLNFTEIDPTPITPENRNYTRTVTLKPDYSLTKNLTLAGEKEISWNATEYVTVSFWETSEYMDAIQGDPANDIFKNDASRDEKELDLEKNNYTLVVLNEETETVNATLKVRSK